MNLKSTIVLLAATSLAVLPACIKEKPSAPDRANSLVLYAIDTSRVASPDWQPVPEATVRVNATTIFLQETYETDPAGKVAIGGLPAGEYIFVAEKTREEENVLIIGNNTRNLRHATGLVDTVFMSYLQASPLVINEVYYCGSAASKFYFYDQFIELYNSSSETIHLDGYIICRGTQLTDLIDFQAIDFALGYYGYVFPGTRGETELCPIEPGQHLVIAADAIDHSLWARGGVDLSGADWEFFNALSNDYDVPGVPNLETITENGNDFTMNLAHAAIWIATGEEFWFEDYVASNGIVGTYLHVPLWTIVDAVEYSSNPESDKYISREADAGLGGNTMTKYSARSIERRFPGLDSNNSTFDFVIIGPPTPGTQH